MRLEKAILPNSDCSRLRNPVISANMLEWGITIVFVLPAILIAGYYFAFTIFGMRRKQGVPADDSFPRHSFGILIPAHNEELLLLRCLRSIPASSKIGTLVVADNCTDATAKSAEEFGVECIVRNDAQRIGKGYALATGMPAVMAHRPDAILILDADCALAPGTLEAFDAELSADTAVIQAPLEVRHSDNHSSEYIAAVGAEIDATLHRGWYRKGGSVPLRGTGMLFRREVLESHPWSMHGLAEDAEFTAVLRRAGVRVSLLQNGTIHTEAPHTAGDLLQQRRRWRAALSVPGLGWLERILTSKPLILAHLFAGWIAVLLAPVPDAMRMGMYIAMGMTALVYLRSMAAVGFRWPGIGGAVLVARLAGVTLAGFWKRETTWQRTARR